MLVPKLRFKREDGTNYSDWKFLKIDKMAEINPKSSAIPEQFYYMDLGSVSMGLWQDKTAINKENAPSRANRLAICGDVFFQSVRPYNMGHYCLLQEYDLPVVASTGFIQLRARKGYCNTYIYQLLYEDRFNAEVTIRCTGSNYPAINSENFSDIEVMSPCLEEQQKIADFLSTVDEVIAQSEAEVQNLQQQKKTVMQKIFSQEVRFKREDGMEYPEWEEYSIAEIVSKVFDIDHYMPDSVENGIPYVMTADLVEHSEIDFDNCKKVSYEDYCKLSKKGKTEKGDIIFARYATIGTVKLVETDRVFLVSYSCVTIKELSNKLTNRFLYQYFCSSLFAKKIKTQINTGTQGNIGIDILKQHRLLLPHIEEQQKIADFLSDYDEAISYAKQELDKWKELKKGLLQQMFV